MLIRPFLSGQAFDPEAIDKMSAEIRVAVAAYFHGSPYPIYRCLGRMVPGRDGSLYLTTWPGGKRRNRKQTGKKERDAFQKFLKSVRNE